LIKLKTGSNKLFESKLFWIVIIIVAILFSTFIFSITRKKDIKEASISEIEQVYDIGSVLAVQIKEYAINNNIKSVDDLNIKYVGEVRKKELKKKFK
jgi:DNA uptake protein ComE-like DNA-binding protein